MTEKRPSPNDWRRQGQERYLLRAVLSLHKYVPYRPGWEHDHCEFCGAKFSPDEGDLRQGYVTDDHYRWVCETCFADFKGEMEWVTESG